MIFQINIGSSTTNEIFINIGKIYSNDKFECIINDHIFPDTFKTWFDGSFLYIKRTDSIEGWGHNHTANIVEKKIYQPPLFNSIIPLNIFQTWHTLNLSPKMKETVENLKFQNPEFTHYLYDDIMCRDFISKHFDKDVLYTFDRLKPGAYKADLWRYCILYIKGGIYLDIKYNCVNGFKLIELTDKEYYVRDIFHSGITGIYQALIVCFPNNKLMYNCINQIIHYVKTDFYGYTSLDITGPHMMSLFFNEIMITNLDLSYSNNTIFRNNKNILYTYDSYRDEQNDYYRINNMCHYNNLWNIKNIYNYKLLKPQKLYDFSRQITKFINNENYLFHSNLINIIELPNNIYLVNLRWINYTQINKGVNNISLNSRFKINEFFEQINDEIFMDEDYNLLLNNEFMGLENVQIFNNNDKYYYTSTKGNNIREHEKTLAFLNYKGELSIIYKWFPLQIGKINDIKKILDIIEIKYNIPDYFKDLRCNTNGYIKNNEIWFILHKEDTFNQNNYRHCFAIFDLDLNLIRYSELFKFENFKIEFCTGIIIKEREIILSHSLLEKKNNVEIYDIDTINTTIKWYTN